MDDLAPVSKNNVQNQVIRRYFESLMQSHTISASLNNSWLLGRRCG